MKLAELLEERRPAWGELESLTRDLARKGPRRMGAPAISRFASLYRSACADLALADAYQLPLDTISYLHALVGRAHNQLYRSQTFQFAAWGREMFVALPQRLVRDGALWLAMGIFWGSFALSMWLGYSSPAYTNEVVGESAIAQLEDSFSHRIKGRDPLMDSQMAAFYVFNNAGIGLRCFAAGLLFGIGGLFITVSNSVLLGAVFGHMLTVEQRPNFLEFVTAHGPFELTAVVFASAAGMRLGFALIATGGLARGESLRRAAERAAPMAAAAVLLFMFAAMIEGFVSPSNLPYAVKAGVAIASSAVLVAYLLTGLLRKTWHAI